MNTIIPAIIPESRVHLAVTLQTLAPFAKEVQIDIVDGVFVPSVSWPYCETSSIAEIESLIQNFDVELDCMFVKPEAVLPEYLALGVGKVIVHVESTDALQEIALLKSAYDFKLGLSISNDTPLEVLTDHLAYADYVQLMGIAQIGSQGQPFDTRVIDRVRLLHNQYPELLISIDGSMNAETIPLVRSAGASRFVVGSAILGAENPQEAYETLVA